MATETPIRTTDILRDRLGQVIASLGMSQARFAAMMGISRSLLSQLVNGERTIQPYHLELIQRVHNVNEAWLLRGEGEMFAGHSWASALDGLDLSKSDARPADMVPRKDFEAVTGQLNEYIKRGHAQSELQVLFDELSPSQQQTFLKMLRSAKGGPAEPEPTALNDQPDKGERR